MCVFLDGEGAGGGRNVSLLRQCLYKNVYWMSFESKSGDCKAQIQQPTFSFSVNCLIQQSVRRHGPKIAGMFVPAQFCYR